MGPGLHRQCEARWQNPLSVRRTSCPFRRLKRLPVTPTANSTPMPSTIGSTGPAVATRHAYPPAPPPGRLPFSCFRKDHLHLSWAYQFGLFYPALLRLVLNGVSFRERHHNPLQPCGRTRGFHKHGEAQSATDLRVFSNVGLNVGEVA